MDNQYDFADRNSLRRSNTSRSNASNLILESISNNKSDFVFNEDVKSLKYKRFDKYISLTDYKGRKKIFDMFTLFNSDLNIKLPKKSLWDRLKDKFNL
jgi:hypothetical protein